jgi:hypothetical protein
MKLVPMPSKKKLTVSEYCSKCGTAIYQGWQHKCPFIKKKP